MSQLPLTEEEVARKKKAFLAGQVAYHKHLMCIVPDEHSSYAEDFTDGYEKEQCKDQNIEGDISFIKKANAPGHGY